MNEIIKEENYITEDNSIKKVLRFPKNIRQVGMPAMDERIYIEDYVVTFLHQINYDFDIKNILIFVGNKCMIDGNKCIFINGLIKVNNVIKNENTFFSEEIWDEIKEKKKEYFEEMDILGWCIACSEWDGNEDELVKIQKNNFSDEENLFMIYEFFDKEENIYKILGNKILKEKGFYIYYERNEKMQNYMLNEKGNKSIEYGYYDETTDKIKKAINRNNVDCTNTRKINNKNRYKKCVVFKDKNLKMVSKKNANDRVSGVKNVAVMIAILAILAVSAEKIDNIKRITTTKAEQAILNVNNKANNYKDNEDKNVLEVESVLGEVSKINMSEPEEEREVVKINEEIIEENIEITGGDIPEKTQVVEETKEPEENENTQELKETLVPKAQKDIKKNSNKTYKVQKGDGLIDISRKMYGNIDNVDRIMKANNIENENMIYEGQELLIP